MELEFNHKTLREICGASPNKGNTFLSGGDLDCHFLSPLPSVADVPPLFAVGLRTSPDTALVCPPWFMSDLKLPQKSSFIFSSTGGDTGDQSPGPGSPRKAGGKGARTLLDRWAGDPFHRGPAILCADLDQPSYIWVVITSGAQ